MQQVLLEAADELTPRGRRDAARVMLDAVADLLQSDRDAAEDALRHAEADQT